MPNCSQVLFYILFTQVADYIAWLPIQPPWNMPRANLRLPSHRTASNPELHFLSAISYHPFPPGTTDTIQCLANFQPYAGAQKKKKKKNRMQERWSFSKLRSSKRIFENSTGGPKKVKKSICFLPQVVDHWHLSGMLYCWAQLLHTWVCSLEHRSRFTSRPTDSAKVRGV